MQAGQLLWGSHCASRPWVNFTVMRALALPIFLAQVNFNLVVNHLAPWLTGAMEKMEEKKAKAVSTLAALLVQKQFFQLFLNSWCSEMRSGKAPMPATLPQWILAKATMAKATMAKVIGEKETEKVTGERATERVTLERETSERPGDGGFFPKKHVGKVCFG